MPSIGDAFHGKSSVRQAYDGVWPDDIGGGDTCGALHRATWHSYGDDRRLSATAPFSASMRRYSVTSTRLATDGDFMTSDVAPAAGLSSDSTLVILGVFPDAFY